MANTLRVYSYSGCGTCRKALKWLSERGLRFEVLAIRETPPTPKELRLALKQVAKLRLLFNSSGGDYKALALKDKIGTMTEDEAVRLLSSNGNLVKRPFILLPNGGVLVGFDEETFERTFSQS